MHLGNPSQARLGLLTVTLATLGAVLAACWAGAALAVEEQGRSPRVLQEAGAPGELPTGVGLAHSGRSLTGSGFEPADRTAPDSIVDESLVVDLLNWIGEQSRYDVSAALAHPPTISLSQNGDTVDYEDQRVVVGETLKAFYDKAKRRIYLVEPWVAAEPDDVGTLLHELVHDVQSLNKEWSCWNRAEWEAYQLQEAWLIEQGREPALNWVQIFILSSCRTDIHP